MWRVRRLPGNWEFANEVVSLMTTGAAPLYSRFLSAQQHHMYFPKSILTAAFLL
jgi:hypothetical protein